MNHVETLPSGRPFVTLRCFATSSAMSSALKLAETPALARLDGGFVTPLRPRRALRVVCYFVVADQAVRINTTWVALSVVVLARSACCWLLAKRTSSATGQLRREQMYPPSPQLRHGRHLRHPQHHRLRRPLRRQLPQHRCPQSSPRRHQHRPQSRPLRPRRQHRRRRQPRHQQPRPRPHWRPQSSLRRHQHRPRQGPSAPAPPAPTTVAPSGPSVAAPPAATATAPVAPAATAPSAPPAAVSRSAGRRQAQPRSRRSVLPAEAKMSAADLRLRVPEALHRLDYCQGPGRQHLRATDPRSHPPLPTEHRIRHNRLSHGGPGQPLGYSSLKRLSHRQHGVK